jgi:hypothetical protein
MLMFADLLREEDTRVPAHMRASRFVFFFSRAAHNPQKEPELRKKTAIPFHCTTNKKQTGMHIRCTPHQHLMG